MLANLSVPGSAQSQQDAIAVVNGETITFAKLKTFLPPGFESFEPEKAVAVQKVALDNAIISVILGAEARKRKISVPLLRKQMTAGRVRVADRQVEEEYRKNARYFGLMSPDEAKEKLRVVLEAEARMKLYRTALAKLRAPVRVEIRLTQDRPATFSLRAVGPSKGPPSAPVTITMFSDFECSHCKESQHLLARIIEAYPNDVRLVFRHLPLRGNTAGLTPGAAAICADKQGKFWMFHDSVYERGLYSPAELRRTAAAVELNMDRFEECVASGIANGVIAADVAEARRLNIDGTPTFIVNGKIYKGAIAFDEFKKIVEGEIRSSLKGKNP